MGFARQQGLVWALTSIGRIDYVVATVVAVEAAVLHNFFWHSSWTWSDRVVPSRKVIGRLVRFNVTTGAVSIAGNVAVTVALVHLVGMPYVAANIIAIAACFGTNFLLNHRVIFVPSLCVLVTLGAVADARGAELLPASSAAFDHEARLVAARLDDEREGRAALLRIDRLPADRQRESYTRLRHGDMIVERLPMSNQAFSLPGAMLHHWIGTTLIAGVTLDPVMRLMQGYNRYQEVYRPGVRRSRVLARDGDTFDVALQLYAKKEISIVLNTESRVTYLPVDASRMQVRSISTRIAEVREAGEAGEREAPIGHDNGFLWRFNNYCSLEERVEGTYVQCETLSLTRDTPFGLGWMIDAFVTSIPRESPERTLDAMRTSVQSSLK
jgi:putative flippase GtrA